MKFFWLSILLFVIGQTGYAQNPSNFDFFLGYGFYEGYNIGCEYNFKSDIHSISLSTGYERSLNKVEESFSLTFGYDHAILKNRLNTMKQFKWRLSSRFILWQLEDPYYLWRAISLIPSIDRRFMLSEKITLSVDFGPSFNIVLQNKRKTFEEVGWPYHIMPNCRILLVLRK